MLNPWDAIHNQLDEWGAALERRILRRVVRVLLDLQPHKAAAETAFLESVLAELENK